MSNLVAIAAYRIPSAVQRTPKTAVITATSKKMELIASANGNKDREGKVELVARSETAPWSQRTGKDAKRVREND